MKYGIEAMGLDTARKYLEPTCGLFNRVSKHLFVFVLYLPCGLLDGRF